jgi:hypothetical protein
MYSFEFMRLEGLGKVGQLSFRPKRHVRKDGSAWYHLKDGSGTWEWEAKKKRKDGSRDGC